MLQPEFAVVGGDAVRAVLWGRHHQVVDLIRQAYLTHGAGASVNPPSYFLRFPDRPDSRIIALPASLGGEFGVDGIKWVSSFPGNISNGLPRASAALILNDATNGHPIACLEGSIISATRTAASAVLAAGQLRPGARRVAYFGTGLIARYIHEFFTNTGWQFDEVGIFDLSTDYANQFRDKVIRADATIHETPEAAIRGADLVVFATTSATPHVHDLDWFSHNPTVLHVSLRDLAPEIILASTNIVDDVDHCLKANTSPHLAEQQTGDRDFIHGTLCDVLEGRVTIAPDRPLVFSPFGLGVLDLALGQFVLEQAAKQDTLHRIDGFFADLSRY